jgi:hypothetical protein
MAILTDLLIASTSEAEAICADPQHHVRWPCLQWRNIDVELFGDLLAALGEKDHAKALRAGRGIIHKSDSTNSLVCICPMHCLLCWPNLTMRIFP